MPGYLDRSTTSSRFRTPVLAIAVLAGAASLSAGPGSLDLTFNRTGTVLTDFGTFTNERVGGVAVDAQNRIVVAGCSDVSTTNAGLATIRYNPDGSLDPAFGTGGKALTQFGHSVCADGLTGVALDGSGRILVVSGLVTASGDIDFVLVRYTENGSLDTSFGTNGFVTTDFGNWDVATAVAVDQFGRIVVAGWTIALGSTDFAVARYNSDGSLDTTFNTTGKKIFDFKGPNVFDAASAVITDSADRIIVVGTSGGQFDEAIGVARLSANGAFDTTFNGTGKILTSFPGSTGDSASAVTLDDAGRIVVGATTGGAGGSRMAVVRYNADGTLDNLFGSGGKAIGPPSFASAVVIDPDGRIVVAGNAGRGVAGDPSHFAVTRFTADGLPDSTFGTDGNVITAFGAVGDDFATGAAIDRTGRIVVAGHSSAGNGLNSFDFAVARYQSNSSADVSVAIADSPDPVVAGSPITYTLTVSNTGPDAAQSVIVTDMLPASVSFVSCSATAGGVCGGGGNNQTVSFGSLAPGANATITLQAASNLGTADGASIVNTATVSSVTPDPNLSNNSATATTTVHDRSDLFTTMSVSKLSSRQLQFSITVQNLGPFDARQVLLVDVVPAGTNLASLTAGGWNCAAPAPGAVGTVSCAIPSLAASASQSLTMVVNVTASGNMSLSNTATASAATLDPNPANNSVTLVTRISGR